ncbi:MAG: hypothetical protein AABW80_02995 [Nanoarchaeota archaeon]
MKIDRLGSNGNYQYHAWLERKDVAHLFSGCDVLAEDDEKFFILKPDRNRAGISWNFTQEEACLSAYSLAIGLAGLRGVDDLGVLVRDAGRIVLPFVSDGGRENDVFTMMPDYWNELPSVQEKKVA